MLKLLFFGDSITDCHRSITNPLGDGYVKMLDDMLEDSITNKGVSGDTTKDLINRLKEDVLDTDANTVYMMIGINDVWQRFKDAYKSMWIYPENYKRNLEEIIKTIIDSGKEVVLISPFYLDLNLEDKMRKLTNSYQEILKGVASEFALEYIDVQAVFDDYLKKEDYKSLSDDKVHVNEKGNQIIAETIYEHMNS